MSFFLVNLLLHPCGILITWLEKSWITNLKLLPWALTSQNSAFSVVLHCSTSRSDFRFQILRSKTFQVLQWISKLKLKTHFFYYIQIDVNFLPKKTQLWDLHIQTVCLQHLAQTHQISLGILALVLKSICCQFCGPFQYNISWHQLKVNWWNIGKGHKFESTEDCTTLI